MTDWTTTITFEGSPRREELSALEDKLDAWDGSASVAPHQHQFFVTLTVDGATWEATTAMSTKQILALVREFGVDDSAVLGVETLRRDEYDRRADEPTVPQLLSAPDVANVLNVSRQRVHQLATLNKRFPEPLLRLGSGPLWIADAIRRFDREWDRKPGRPRRVAGVVPTTVRSGRVVAAKKAAKVDAKKTRRRMAASKKTSKSVTQKARVAARRVVS
jgi:hypothetical protein